MGLGFAAIGVGIMQMSRLQAYYPKETRLPFIFVSVPAALLLFVVEDEIHIRELYTRVLMAVVIMAILWVDHLRCKG